MNKKTISKLKKILYGNLFASILLLFIMVASISGATYAWFTSESELHQNIFTAGTVKLSQPGGELIVPQVVKTEPEIISSDMKAQSAVEFVYSDTDGEQTEARNDQSPADYVYGDSEEPPSAVMSAKVVNEVCEKIKWTFQNTGTKGAYVRVKPIAGSSVIYIAAHLAIDTETAFIGIDPRDATAGREFLALPGHNFGQYITYNLGAYTITDPLILPILAGANYANYGSAKIWDNGEKLFIEFDTGTNYIKDIHIYAGLAKPDHAKFGHFGWAYTVSDGTLPPSTSSFTFSTDRIYLRQPNPKDKLDPEVLISSLASGSQSNVNIELCSGYEGSWLFHNGWWYYGTSARPLKVESGAFVEVCFTYCYIEGQEKPLYYLLADAVQWSNGAINYEWPEHPWYYLLQ